MKAIIIGATGATGKDLLNLLLKDDSFDEIEIFVRRDLEISNNKLKTHIIDFNEPEEWKNDVNGDVLFSCLGTTLKVAGSKENMRKIDFTYQYEFAKAAKENGIKNYVLVSSAFASPKSPFFYAKLKGQLEEAVNKLGFQKTLIFNPPLLERANSTRKAEVGQAKIIKFFNSVGLLKSQKPLSTKLLAKALIYATKNLDNGAYSVGPKKIWQFLNE